MSKYSLKTPILHRFYNNLCTNIVFKSWYFLQNKVKNLKKDGNTHEIPTFYQKMLVYIEDLQN